MGVMLYDNTDKAFKDIQAMQKFYTSANAWKDCTSAKVNEDGVWVEKLKKSPLYLYKEGNECTDVTGGWQCYYTEPNYNGGFAKNSNNLYLKIVGYAENNNGSAYMGTVNNIDLTPYNKIHIDYAMSNSYAKHSIGLILRTSKPTNYSGVAQVVLDNSSRIVVGKDISSFDGLLYVGFRLNSANGTATLNVYNVWLE